MGTTCLNCGKRLGSRTTLCYTCHSDGIDPETITEIDESVVERLERYFIVSSIKCAECEELHGTVTVDGESYTAADFAIDSLEEWELEMDKEETWIQGNEEAVQAALPRLEAEWPHCVSAVQNHVL